MNLLRLIGNGIGLMAEPYVNPRDYNKSTMNGWNNDNKNLRGDVKAVGTYMGRAVSNGKSHAGPHYK